MLSARQVEPRRFVSALLFTLVLAVAGGGLAWACTPQATLTLKPSSAPAGTTVEVKGENYTKAGRPVRIRWGSFDGPLLATAHPAENDSSFTVSIEIPQVAPGTYTVVGVPFEGSRVLRRPDGSSGGRASFTVTAPAPQGGAGTPQAGPPPQPGAGPRPDPSRGGDGDRPRTGGDPGRRPASSGGSDAPPVLTTASGRRVFGGSVAPSTPGRRAGFAGDRPGSAAATGPSERTAIGDLWSGFGSRSVPSLLPNGADPATPGSGPGAELPIGAGLLGLGLVVLLAGFGLAEARRRRPSA